MAAGISKTILYKMSDTRVDYLAEKHQTTQKKTFTKWMNGYLKKVELEVGDLFRDLSDGLKLMKLLEIITSEDIGKPTKGNMRVHKISNVNMSLAFVKSKVRLESIGGEDIVDGNPTLILGLIWTIILRFQIQQMIIHEEGEEDAERNQNKRSQKDKILDWCKKIAVDYPNLNIKNFSSSWNNGMGFNALIHAHRPDIIDYDSLRPDEPIKNLNNAFDVAEKELGVERILDAEDIATSNPDEKSILTYLASLYQNIIHSKKPDPKHLKDNADIQTKYDAKASDLMKWILAKVSQLEVRHFPDSIGGLLELKRDLASYRWEEKHPKHNDRIEIASILYALQSGLKMLRMPPYVPAAGCTLSDIQTHWIKLERTEIERDRDLDKALERRKYLEHLARIFQHECKQCESFLKTMQLVLEEVPDKVIVTLEDLKALVSKNEDLAFYIMEKQLKIDHLTKMADELEAEKYPDHDIFRSKEREVLSIWNEMIALIENRKTYLHGWFGFVELMCKAKTIELSIQERKTRVNSSDIGCHLLAVEDLLEKHSVQESHVSFLGESLEYLGTQGETFMKTCHGTQGETFMKTCHVDTSDFQKKLRDVKESYQILLHITTKRREKLEVAKVFFQLEFDIEEERVWVQEQQLMCKTKLTEQNLNVVDSILQRHKLLEEEMRTRWARAEMLIKSAGQLSKSNIKEARGVSLCGGRLKQQWSLLHQYAESRHKRLERAVLVRAFYTTAYESELWIKETMVLFEIKSFGESESSDMTASQQHAKLDVEIKAYEAQIKSLNALGQKLIQSETSSSVIPQRKVSRASSHASSSSSSSSSDSSSDEEEKQNKPNDEAIKTKHTYKKKLSFEEPEAIEKRLQATNTDYWHLCDLSQQRQQYLKESIKAYSFFRECDEFEDWLKDRERYLKIELSEDLEIEKKKFDKIVTVLEPAGIRLVIIDKNVQDFIASGHSQLEKIKQCKSRLYEQWALINRLRQQRQHDLQAAGTVNDYLQSCDEIQALMEKKMERIGDGGLDRDLEAIQSLQRGLDQLEKELRPTEEKLKRVNLMAESFKISYPNDSKVVTKRQQEIQSYWQNLNDKLKNRKAALEQAFVFIVFKNSAESLYYWIIDIKQKVSTKVISEDVTLSKHQLDVYQGLSSDLQSLQKELEELKRLGGKVMKKSSKAQEVQEKLKALEDETAAVQEAWQLKLAHLQQTAEYMLFTREAEYLDVTTRSHEAFIGNQDLGETLDSAELLLKRHTEFESLLSAQRERMEAFVQVANKLIEANNSETENIILRKDEVYDRRTAVYDLAKTRKEMLNHSVTYQKFRAEALDFEDWMGDKKIITEDHSYRTLLSIQRKMKNHEVLESELRSNESRLQSITKLGQDHVDSEHYQTENILQTVTSLNDDWKDLSSKTRERGIKLQQAHQECSYNEHIQEVVTKMDVLYNMIKANEVPQDLRSCMIIRNKEKNLASDLSNLEQIISELSETAEVMIKAEHFDANNIEASCRSTQARLDEIKALIEQEHTLLEESIMAYTLIHEVDLELQLISDYNLLASSKDFGINVPEVRVMLSKHKKLTENVKNHQTKLNDLSERGKKLLEERHSQSDMIETQMTELQRLWLVLQDNVKERESHLEQNLKAQNCLAEVRDLEALIESSKHKLKISPDATDRKRRKSHSRSHSNSSSSSSGSDSRSQSQSHSRKHSQGVKHEMKHSHSQSSGSSSSSDRSRSRSNSGGRKGHSKDKPVRSHSKSSSRSRSRSHSGGRKGHSKDKSVRSHSKSSSRSRSHSGGYKGHSKDKSVRSHSKSSSRSRSRSHSGGRRGHSKDKPVRSHSKSGSQSRSRSHSGGRKGHSKDKPVRSHSKSSSRSRSRSHSSGRKDRSKEKHGKSQSKSRSRSHSNDRKGRSKDKAVTKNRNSNSQTGSRSSSSSNSSSSGRSQSPNNQPSKDATRRHRSRRSRRRSRKHRPRREDTQARSHSNSNSSSNSDDSEVEEAEILLAKHKALDMDIQIYNEALVKLSAIAETMQEENHPQSQQIQERVQVIGDEVKNLQKELDDHQNRLQHNLDLQQYLQEACDLDQFIAAHKLTPTSEDLYQDYEHIVSLQIKFDYLKGRVRSGDDRFKHCDGLAEKLMADGNHYASHVEKRHKKLRSEWNNLLQHIEVTTRELKEAGELHIFRRDVADFRSLFSEKEAKISGDIGLDLATIKFQQLKLVLLEKDLVVLKAQRDGLVSTAVNLRTTYQGGKTEELITLEERYLDGSWEILLKKIAKRKEQLALAAERQHFIIETHTLLDWTHNLQATIKEKEQPKSVEEVLVLKANQEQLKAEIDARKDDFSKVMETGRHMVDENGSHSGRPAVEDNSRHSEKDSSSSSESSDSHSDNEEEPLSEIKNEIEELSKQWTQLFNEVNSQARGLEGVKDIVDFDAKISRILHKIRSKLFLLDIHEKDADDYLKAYVADGIKSHDVEIIQDLVRRHRIFEEHNTLMEKEVFCLREEAALLMEKYPQGQNHISSKLLEINDSFSYLIKESNDRRDKLHHAEKIQEYFDEYQEFMILLNEMLVKITAPDLPVDVQSSELVIAHHKKYKLIFDVHIDKFEDFESKGRALCAEGHFMKDEIERRIEHLESRGTLLIETWKARYVIYKINLDVRAYLRDAKEFEDWLDSEELNLNKGDLGHSVEEVEELIKKHIDFTSSIDSRSQELQCVKRLTAIEKDFEAQKRLEGITNEKEGEHDMDLARKMEKSTLKIKKQEEKRKSLVLEAIPDFTITEKNSSGSSSSSEDEMSIKKNENEGKERSGKELVDVPHIVISDKIDAARNQAEEITITDFNDVRKEEDPGIAKSKKENLAEFHEDLSEEEYFPAVGEPSGAFNSELNEASDKIGSHSVSFQEERLQDKNPFQEAAKKIFEAEKKEISEVEKKPVLEATRKDSSTSGKGFSDESEDDKFQKKATSSSDGESAGDGKKKKHKNKKKSKKQKKGKKKDCKVM